MFGQNVDEHNPAPLPSGHPLLSGPPTLNDIHQIFTPPCRRQSENPETPPTNARTAPQEPNAAKGPASLDMTRPLLLILLAHNAAASSLADITRVERTLTFPGWRRQARETRRKYIKYAAIWIGDDGAQAAPARR